MLNESELAELRSLQQRAYGRDGALTAADLDRLRELSGGPDAAPVAEPARLPVAELVEASGAPQLPLAEPIVPVAEPIVPVAEPVEASARPTASRPWVRIGAAAAAIAIGLGIGWLWFGRDSGLAIPITAEQQARGVEIAAEAKFDPASIIPLAEDDGTIAWVATRNDGEMTCVILDDGERSQEGCGDAAMVDEGGVSAMLISEGSSGTDVTEDTVYGTLFRAGTGDLIAVIQRWTNQGSNYLDQFTDESERATAERLTEDGADEWSATLVGYDAKTPIWTTTRNGGNEICLFYGGEADAPSTCAGFDAAHLDSLTISVAGVTDLPADPVSFRDVTLSYTSQGMPFLVITDRGAAVGVTDRTESGDPIEYYFDDLAHESDE